MYNVGEIKIGKKDSEDSSLFSLVVVKTLKFWRRLSSKHEIWRFPDVGFLEHGREMCLNACRTQHDHFSYLTNNTRGHFAHYSCFFLYYATRKISLRYYMLNHRIRCIYYFVALSLP